jgi:cell filamentation protein
MSNASDPYLYPGTNVLRNIPDLRDAGQLATFESNKTSARIYKHLRSPIKGEFDASHLKAIHKHVFQDVFAWAGRFRTTVLGKPEFVGQPARWFTPPHAIEYEADQIFATLHQANLLRGLSRVGFVGGAVQLFANINKLHPFREGNGRTQRIFIDALARHAGHEISFDVVSMERMVSASIEALDGDLGILTRIFEEITDERRIQPLRRAIAFLSANQFEFSSSGTRRTSQRQAGGSGTAADLSVAMATHS